MLSTTLNSQVLFEKAFIQEHLHEKMVLWKNPLIPLLLSLLVRQNYVNNSKAVTELTKTQGKKGKTRHPFCSLHLSCSQLKGFRLFGFGLVGFCLVGWWGFFSFFFWLVGLFFPFLVWCHISWSLLILVRRAWQ